jgi:hypothetical protein
LGRQTLYLDEALTLKLRGRPATRRDDGYCEWLLKEHYGATEVESMDFSGYEHATRIQDMNRPVPVEMHDTYDTVFDGGTLEHVYNVPQALRNVSDMCRTGGQIIHAVPANNMCGHGFWQFSPELFFSLYSEANGYSDTEVFLADMSDHRKWYKVRKPYNGMRVEIKSDYEVLVWVRTVLRTRVFSHAMVQQSDYVERWSQQGGVPMDSTPVSGHPLKRLLSKHPAIYRTAQILYSPLGSLVRLARDLSLAPKRLKIPSTEKLDGRNPWLESVRLRDSD